MIIYPITIDFTTRSTRITGQLEVSAVDQETLDRQINDLANHGAVTTLLAETLFKQTRPETNPPDPGPGPEPEPEPQQIKINTLDPNAKPISGVEVTSPAASGVSDEGGVVLLTVFGPQLYHFRKDGWQSKNVDLPPGEHNVHLEKVNTVPGPTPPGSLKPLVGYLRPQGNNSVGDDSGPRSIRGFSLFPLVRFMHDKPDWALQQLDKAVGRYHIARVFWHLAHPLAWVPMNASVSPVTDSWFDAAFERTLRECWARGIYVDLTSGDHAVQVAPNRWEEVLKDSQLPGLYKRVAGIAKSVNEQVIGINEAINEGRVNSLHRDDYDFWKRCLQDFQSVYPWGIQVTTDPDGDPEANVWKTARPPVTSAVSIHGTRTTAEDSIRRAYNLRYEPPPGVDIEPVLETENTGIDTGKKPGVTDGTTDRDHIFGLYGTKILTGQVLIHFDSAGLGWHHYPIDREWGFYELPQRWNDMGIPENIGLWKCIPGHKAEAPVTALSFADKGDGPARCDNVVSPDGKRGYAIVYYGVGTWRIQHREGVPMTAWRAEGNPQSVTGTWKTPAEKVVILEWHK